MTDVSQSNTTTTTTTTTTEAVAPTKRTYTWGGSLVGVTNNAPKKAKIPRENLPTSIIIQLTNPSGDNVAEAMDVSIDLTTDNLTDLVNQLISGDDEDNKKQMYNFYANLGGNKEVEFDHADLADFIMEHHVSTEDILKIRYSPQSVFQVRSVSRCTDTLPGHTEAILHVSYSPNGKYLASGGGDTTVRFWDSFTNMPRYTGKHKNHVLCTAWSPCGHVFMSADLVGDIKAWSPHNLRECCSVRGHKGHVSSLAFEPLHLSTSDVTEHFVSSSKDCLVNIWKIAHAVMNHNDKSNNEEEKEEATAAATTIKGKKDKAATKISKKDKIKVTKIHKVISLAHTAPVEVVKWSGEGLIYSAGRDRVIKIWSGQHNEMGKLLRTLSGHGHRINCLALNCDYVTRTGPFSFTNKVASRAKALEHYQKFKESNPNEILVSGSDDFSLFVWSGHLCKEKKRLSGHQLLINAISFSPCGSYFASASFDKKIKIWSASGAFLRTLTGHVGAVYCVSWSCDSRFLVSASKDSTAKVWNVSAGSKKDKKSSALETLPGHADEVYALDWSPNGNSVA
eukprot:CAMPEP_0116030348 /NCGR_PEP_ID=MMETSP0321-20121206/16801_1 /TAXON_ID=163516 /ORGANISM="Leptocylindrus danicus var. danicus, Strain B650" /LENGTH=564 /DNA_ID=CAMNT_0003505137 /DNA_START=59 /DNA_END=1749 /DNA_ORIENTATION=+